METLNTTAALPPTTRRLCIASGVLAREYKRPPLRPSGHASRDPHRKQNARTRPPYTRVQLQPPRVCARACHAPRVKLRL